MGKRYLADIYEKLERITFNKAKKSSQILGMSYHKLNWFKSLKPITVLFVRDRGCNVPYLDEVLTYLKAKGHIKLRILSLSEYVKPFEEDFDILIYQTWFWETGKHDLEDEKFLACKRPKILFDANASGSFDNYNRFNNPQIPRIKNAPSEQFLKDFNVILPTTHPVDVLPYRRRKKIVDVSYCVGTHTHEVRPKIYEILENFATKHSFSVDLDKNKHNYKAYLRRTRISVNAPGYGEGTFRHLYTLNAGSLLLAHDSILPIQLLPHAKLIDGRDFISFNINNLENKLLYYLQHQKELEAIALRGYYTFLEGYSVPRSALTLLAQMHYLL